jgi:hypothetical protein
MSSAYRYPYPSRLSSLPNCRQRSPSKCVDQYCILRPGSSNPDIARKSYCAARSSEEMKAYRENNYDGEFEEQQKLEQFAMLIEDLLDSGYAGQELLKLAVGIIQQH